MSADNGYILRKNVDGAFVVQMFFASADFFPSIDEFDAHVFKTLEEAIKWYEMHAGYSEYGLTVHIESPTHVETPERQSS